MEKGMDKPAASTAGLVIQGAVTTRGLGEPRERVALIFARSQALTRGCMTVVNPARKCASRSFS
jgi:hypothetical protein